MRRLCSLWVAKEGSAAAEIALCAPLLVLILVGSIDLGNYFMDEHVLEKAVRDGARFAARQSFSAYDCGTHTADQDIVVTPTENVVRSGVPTGGTDRLPNWDSATFSVTVDCFPSVVNGKDSGGNDITENMTGIYTGQIDGAPVVTVQASVPYFPVIGTIGFSTFGFTLNATEQAAVSGI
jgi:Flp pilus assembly protein TadG